MAGVSKWVETARRVLDTEIDGLKAVRDQLDGGFTKAVEAMASCTGRVVITGVGKSGLVGRKIAATLSSTGTPAFFLHPVEGAHGDMGMIRDEDVVLAISNSGNTDEVNAILPTLKSLGATIVCLVGKQGSRMAELSDIVIEARVPREACPMGLAPTASTTAHLAVGDALAVSLMEHKSFKESDFQRFHPGGSLGQRLLMCVDSLMHTDAMPVVGVGVGVDDAVRVLNEGRMGLVAVVDTEGRLAGVLSDGDVRRLFCAGTLQQAVSIDEIMTRDPKRVRPGDSAAEVLDIMELNQITVLPVVGENERLAGLVHLHDLLGKGQLRFANP
ncbi:KpsF/GutQ family sugar-phosphate isomerase [Salidesulfovibrio brasiliensis]